MTFRRRHRFLRRLALALAFAAAAVSPAAAMPSADGAGSARAPAPAASAPRTDGNGAWDDVAYALGGGAAAIGLAATLTALRTRRDSRLARA